VPPPAFAGEEGVLPDGTRAVIAAGEQRRALVVIDIKHATEPNTSYSAEVALYTFSQESADVQAAGLHVTAAETEEELADIAGDEALTQRGET
jgi:hypothetical protein